MRRVVIPELLDSDSGTPQEIQRAISDLRNINRWFGGVSTTADMIEAVAEQTGKQELSCLEVAAASGEVPLAAKRRLAPRVKLQVTLLDRAMSHLKEYRPSVVGDGLSLPFRDDSFDVINCSLFAHHLEPDDLVRFAREALRVCRVALLINDLKRSALHLGLVYAGLPLFRSRITWHDAPASVRRAYTADELNSALEQAGARRIRISSHYLFRMGAIAWKVNTDNSPPIDGPYRPDGEPQ